MRATSCLAASILLTAALLTGCSADFNSITPSQSSIGSLSGAANGGRQPISGARIYLLEANTKVYAGPGLAADSSGTVTDNSSKSLLTSGDGVDSLGNYVLTKSDGSFNITGDYSTCDTGAQVYLYSLGGKPDGANVNTSAGLMAVLGTCGSFGSGTTVNMNELSTIAAAYAFAGFASDATHVGAPSSTDALAATGITNAFANAQQVFDISSNPYSSAKSAPASTKYGGGAVPQEQVNSLANILAACVNSTTSGTQCNTLFAGLKSAGSTGTQATDTATEAIYMAHNPGNTSVYSVTGPGASNPYTPWDESFAPDNFLIEITYTGSNIALGQAVAIDGSGNIWAGSYSSTVSEMSPLGVAASGSPFSGGGINSPAQIAIDSQGNAWIANFGNSNGSATKISVATNPYTISAVGGPSKSPAIAVGLSDDVWIAFGTDLKRFSKTGVLQQTIGINTGGLYGPECLAIDGSGDVWAGNGNDTLSEFTSTGAVISTSAYTGNGIDNPYTMAIDHTGQVWIANDNGGAVSGFANNGTPLAASPVSIPGTNQLADVVDGSGHVWVGTTTGIVELDSSGKILSPAATYVNTGTYPLSMAVDGSGNLWFSHNSENSVNAIDEILGVATPVVTPTAVAVQTNAVGSRP